MTVERKITPEWYKKPEVDTYAREQFFQARTTLDYREVVAEIPAKMMMELGKLAITRKKSFNNLIKEILEEYLENKGVKWKETSDKLEEWLTYGPILGTGITENTREYIQKLGEK